MGIAGSGKGVKMYRKMGEGVGLVFCAYIFGGDGGDGGEGLGYSWVVKIQGGWKETEWTVRLRMGSKVGSKLVEGGIGNRSGVLNFLIKHNSTRGFTKGRHRAVDMSRDVGYGCFWASVWESMFPDWVELACSNVWGKNNDWNRGGRERGIDVGGQKVGICGTRDKGWMYTLVNLAKVYGFLRRVVPGEICDASSPSIDRGSSGSNVFDPLLALPKTIFHNGWHGWRKLHVLSSCITRWVLHRWARYSLATPGPWILEGGAGRR